MKVPESTPFVHVLAWETQVEPTDTNPPWNASVDDACGIVRLPNAHDDAVATAQDALLYVALPSKTPLAQERLCDVHEEPKGTVDAE